MAAITRNDIEANVVVAPSGCWLWEGGVTKPIPKKGHGGYAILRGRPAHRLSYELYVGPIPSGLEIDHLCRQRDCVNWRHLEAVTHAENMRRARKMFCPKGHEKVYVESIRRQRCRRCNVETTMKWRANNDPDGKRHGASVKRYYSRHRDQIRERAKKRREEGL